MKLLHISIKDFLRLDSAYILIWSITRKVLFAEIHLGKLLTGQLEDYIQHYLAYLTKLKGNVPHQINYSTNQ